MVIHRKCLRAKKRKKVKNRILRQAVHALNALTVSLGLRIAHQFLPGTRLTEKGGETRGAWLP